MIPDEVTVAPVGASGEVSPPQLRRREGQEEQTVNLTFQQFESQLRALGFDTVVEQQWGPSAVADTHSHPFEARALVVKGEMWLTIGTVTRQLKAGDRFELLAGQLHAERYGREGAVYWVGRRHPLEAPHA
jgi:hypothetical protein